MSTERILSLLDADALDGRWPGFSLMTSSTSTMISPVTGSLICLAGNAAVDAGRERGGFLVAIVDGGDGDAVGGAAILFGDDDVLGHIDQLAGHVAGVRGLQRGVGETLAGAVGGDEVFEHRETFAEVRDDRAFDDFAGGLGHQAAHAAELLDLGLVTPRAGIDHHEERRWPWPCLRCTRSCDRARWRWCRWPGSRRRRLSDSARRR